MRAARLGLLALVALVSCAPDPRIAVVEGFAPGERLDIARAVAKWNTVLRTPMSLDSAGPWRLVKQEPPDHATKGFSGETVRGNHTVYIMPGLNANTFYEVVLHEFGHVNGLHHVQGRGVMNPNVGETEFTEADLDECQLVGACGLSPVDEAKCRLQGACQ